MPPELSAQSHKESLNRMGAVSDNGRTIYIYITSPFGFCVTQISSCSSFILTIGITAQLIWYTVFIWVVVVGIVPGVRCCCCSKRFDNSTNLGPSGARTFLYFPSCIYIPIFSFFPALLLSGNVIRICTGLRYMLITRGSRALLTSLESRAGNYIAEENSSDNGPRLCLRFAIAAIPAESGGCRLHPFP